jgi:signal transduction histidine kinase
VSARRGLPVRALAFTAVGMCVAGALATLTLVLLNRSTIPRFDAADPISIVMPLTFAAVGGLVALREPRSPVGWLFLFIGVVEGFAGVADQYARLALITQPGSLPGAQWALWFNSWYFGVVWPVGASAMLLILLPNGRLASRGWLPLAVASVVMSVAFVLLYALNPTPMTVTGATTPAVPNPIGVPALQFVDQGTVLYLAGALIALFAATAPLLRMRRADSVERQQLKWIAYAVLLAAASSGAVIFLYALLPDAAGVLSVASEVTLILGFGLALPVAAGIAIFKHGLYQIDVVINRTLVYGALAVLITGVYVGIAVGIGELVGSGGKPNLGLSILATAIVAIGFQPARERLQRVANRLVYGKRATPYEVLSEFSSQVAETYAAEDVLPRMARVLQEGTVSEAATVWLRSGGELRPAATFPDTVAGYEPMAMRNGTLPELPGTTRVVAVRHQDNVLGALSLVKRRGESLTPLEEKLLDDLAHQAGLVLKNVGLTADLQQRLVELRASRQRLVSAQDAERRRLERNLHDGAQQHLVALKVKLGLAEMFAARDPAKVRCRRGPGDPARSGPWHLPALAR